MKLFLNFNVSTNSRQPPAKENRVTVIQKTLQTLGISTLALLTLASAALAQGPMGGPPPGGMGGPGGGMRRMGDELNLTEKQKAKMKAISEASRPKMMAIFQDPKMTREQKMAKIRPIADAQRKQMMAILTPVQRKKAAALMAKRPPMGGPGMGGPGGMRRGMGGPPAPGQ